MKELALSIGGTAIRGAGGAPTGGESTLEGIIRLLITYLYIAAIVLALFYFIWGGINWITSEGDKQRLAQARQKIVFAIIGLVIALLAYFIINLIGAFFGVSLLSQPGIGGGGGGVKP